MLDHTYVPLIIAQQIVTLSPSSSFLSLETILLTYLLNESYYLWSAGNNFFPPLFSRVSLCGLIRTVLLGDSNVYQVLSLINALPTSAVLDIATYNRLILRSGSASANSANENLPKPKKPSLSSLASKPKYLSQSARKKRQCGPRLLISPIQSLRKSQGLALATFSLTSLLNGSSLKTTLTSLLLVSLLVELLNQVLVVLQILVQFLYILQAIIPFLSHQIPLISLFQNFLDFVFSFVLILECVLQGYLDIRQFQQ